MSRLLRVPFIVAPAGVALPFSGREPPFPGSAFSLCHHGPPSRAYRDCDVCMDALADHGDCRDAWDELQQILLSLAWLFGCTRVLTV